MRSGVCSTRTKWEPRTDVAACLSLLPTPNASLANYQEEPATWLARKKKWMEARNVSRAGLPLPIAIKVLLLTPAACDVKGSVPPRPGRAKGYGKLTEQARFDLMPTPTTSDHKGGRNATRTPTENLNKINPGTTLTDLAWLVGGLYGGSTSRLSRSGRSCLAGPPPPP